MPFSKVAATAAYRNTTFCVFADLFPVSLLNHCRTITKDFFIILDV